MIHYSDFSLNFLESEIETCSKYDSTNKRTVKYYNIPAGFDIETTSTTVNNEKFAFMYEWTFGIDSKKHICYGRTWEQFKSLCNDLKTKLKLDKDKQVLVVYVHNLSYEFQFMRKYFEWESVFAVDDRKPIKALTTLGIEFRDSYILSGYSLAKLAENLVNHKIRKLVGDLDYTLVRNSLTKLTDKELEYCNNDVEIVLAYISEQIEQYGNITKIPLTNTGRVRSFVRDKCFYSDKNHKKSSAGKYGRYKELMSELTLSYNEYKLLHDCFMGGFTHASMLHSGKLLENVASIDFTSSYPYAMLSEKFPMSKPEPIRPNREQFEQLVNDENVGLMFVVKFTNIHSKLTFETYISESKCVVKENAIINNGRVYSADTIVTSITDIDYKIIKHCYEWESMEIANVNKFYMQYLPKPILLSIIELYEKKTTLKNVKGKEVEYLRSKGMLNSVYGMCVTNIVRPGIEYKNGWQTTQITELLASEQIDKYNDDKKRFLYYAWGVWVTAYARKNLWNGILNIGEDFIYADTDSIKFLNYDKHIPYIKWYNNEVEKKLKKMCDFRHIDSSRLRPKTIKGIEKPIGVWDYEGMYKYFKTLGAKRYLVLTENNELELTVAGLSKKDGLNYLLRKYKTPKKVFENFNDDLYIPENETGKNTHTYIDDVMEACITDYQGNTEKVTSLSSVHLSPCEFTLSISKQYSKFLSDFRQGYLFTGRKTI